MSNVPVTYDDEIDLLSLLETIWNGKWKIAFIIVVSLLLMLGFDITKPNTFTATIKIKPITGLTNNRFKNSQWFYYYYL